MNPTAIPQIPSDTLADLAFPRTRLRLCPAPVTLLLTYSRPRYKIPIDRVREARAAQVNRHTLEHASLTLHTHNTSFKFFVVLKLRIPSNEKQPALFSLPFLGSMIGLHCVKKEERKDT